jgi:hypothetical protein
MRTKVLAVFSILLALFIIVSRVYFSFPFLYSWDSVQFALSIKEFDVIKHQPHPPGYILYSALLRVVNPFVHDPNKTMIGINIVSSLLASLFIGLLVYELIPSAAPNKRILLASAAATLYATNPINWFYGSLAEIYPLEGCLVAVALYLFVISLRRPSIVPGMAIFLGVAGGIRLTTEFFLLPAYIYILLRADKKTKLISLICFFISNLIWFVPLIYLSHGLNSYFHAVSNQFGREPSRTAGFHFDVSIDILTALVQTITIPIFLFAIHGIKKVRLNPQLYVLILAMIPALLVFIFLHYTKRGYLFILLPTIIAFAIYLLQSSIQNSKWLIVVLSLSVFANITIFLISPGWTSKDAEQHWTKKLIYGLTYPNRGNRDNDEAKFRSFFDSISAFEGKKKLFVIQHGYFPEWRTIMYYYPHDTAMVLLPKKRATIAENFQIHKIRQPYHLKGDERLIILIGPEPVFPMFHAFRSGDSTYYLGFVRLFPNGFRIYAFQFFRK